MVPDGYGGLDPLLPKAYYAPPPEKRSSTSIHSFAESDWFVTACCALAKGLTNTLAMARLQPCVAFVLFQAPYITWLGFLGNSLISIMIHIL